MGINLLVIESDRLFRQGLRHRLEAAPIHVFESDGAAGLKKAIKTHNIDVVLLSLGGLKAEGLALLRQIKKLNPLTEVILLNGASQVSLSIEGMKLGAFDDFFVPFDVRKLIDRIKDAYLRKMKKERSKKSIFQRYQDAMMAAAFAEAGEPETALALYGEASSQSSGKKDAATDKRRLTSDQKGENHG
jgi:DNA-binding NtrC family response regulator